MPKLTPRKEKEAEIIANVSRKKETKFWNKPSILNPKDYF
jgi:hypothetical protein